MEACTSLCLAAIIVLSFLSEKSDKPSKAIENKTKPNNHDEYTQANDDTGAYLGSNACNNGSGPEQQPSIPKNNLEYVKSDFIRSISIVESIVSWLDEHDGLLTAIATIFISIFTYFAVVFAKDQETITKAQLEESEFARRPWIKIDSIDIINISYEIGGTIIVRPQFKLTNVGNSPAEHVVIAIKAYPLFQDEQSHAWQSRLTPAEEFKDIRNETCRSRSTVDNVADVIFQKDSPPPSMPEPKIVRTDIFRKQFGPHEAMTILLVGCFIYRFSPDPAPRYTGFVYRIWGNEKVLTEDRLISIAQVMPAGTILGKDDMRFGTVPGGAFIDQSD